MRFDRPCLAVFHPRVFFVLVLLIASTHTTAAQFEQANRVQLVVRVYIEALTNHAPANLTVQLLDEFGSLEQEGHTDGSGSVEFQTKTQTKRLRIYGPGIQEYNEILEIESMERRKTANVIVSGATVGGAANGYKSGTSLISLARLRVPAKAEEELKKGSEALNRKDWEEAKKRFEAAITIYPGYDLGYNGLGDALLAQGELVAARQAFERAIGLNETFAEAYRNLARISFAEHKYEEADQLLTKSLSADPLNAWALTSAANAELLTQKYDDAIAHARKAHTVPHSGLAGVHIVAALALEARQQPFEGLKEYQLYLDEDPSGRDAVRAQNAIARLSGTPPK